jgi:hypothetical protein
MTGPYVWAWVIMALAAPLALYGFLRATSGLAFAGARHGMAFLLAVWLLVPAAIPNFPGHYAPAFIVFLFEALFQHDGKPRAAGFILAAATLAALALMLLWMLARRLIGRREASG